MRVDDLPAHGLAHANMAPYAAIRRAGRGDGKVSVTPRMAARAEVGSLHGAEAEAMVVVVARRTETTAELARGRVTHEPSRLRRGDNEARPPEFRPRCSIAVQRVLLPRSEMRAGQGFLVLGLVTASTRAVPDGLHEVWMVTGRVTLPTADSLGRVHALGVVRADPYRVAGLTLLDVRGGSGNRSRRIGAWS